MTFFLLLYNIYVSWIWTPSRLHKIPREMLSPLFSLSGTLGFPDIYLLSSPINGFTSFFNCCNIYLPPNWFIVTQFAICMLTRLKKNLISKEVHKQNFCSIPKIIVGRISMYFKAHTWVHILLDFTKLIANATHTKLWI